MIFSGWYNVRSERFSKEALHPCISWQIPAQHVECSATRKSRWFQKQTPRSSWLKERFQKSHIFSWANYRRRFSATKARMKIEQKRPFLAGMFRISGEGLIHTGRATPHKANGTCVHEWECSHCINIKGFAFEFARARPVWMKPNYIVRIPDPGLPAVPCSMVDSFSEHTEMQIGETDWLLWYDRF